MQYIYSLPAGRIWGCSPGPTEQPEMEKNPQNKFLIRCELIQDSTLLSPDNNFEVYYVLNSFDFVNPQSKFSIRFDLINHVSCFTWTILASMTVSRSQRGGMQPWLTMYLIWSAEPEKYLLLLLLVITVWFNFA